GRVEAEGGLRHAKGQVGVVDGNNLAVSHVVAEVHVQRENKGVVVVAEVAGIVGIEAALGRDDLVEAPVRLRQPGGGTGLGDGDIKRAYVRAEVDVLVADDEASNRIVVDHNWIGQAGFAVG